MSTKIKREISVGLNSEGGKELKKRIVYKGGEECGEGDKEEIIGGSEQYGEK